ncbi:MAG: hypothetical protein ACHQQR_12270 [Gemmatimonadales bacterium]
MSAGLPVAWCSGGKPQAPSPVEAMTFVRVVVLSAQGDELTSVAGLEIATRESRTLAGALVVVGVTSEGRGVVLARCVRGMTPPTERACDLAIRRWSGDAPAAVEAPAVAVEAPAAVAPAVARAPRAPRAPTIFDDLTGRTFGRWRVIARAPNEGPKARTSWHCECSCGVRAVVRSSNLKSGASTRCAACRYNRSAEGAA